MLPVTERHCETPGSISEAISATLHHSCHRPFAVRCCGAVEELMQAAKAVVLGEQNGCDTQVRARNIARLQVIVDQCTAFNAVYIKEMAVQGSTDYREETGAELRDTLRFLERTR